MQQPVPDDLAGVSCHCHAAHAHCMVHTLHAPQSLHQPCPQHTGFQLTGLPGNYTAVWDGRTRACRSSVQCNVVCQTFTCGITMSVPFARYD